MWSQAYNRRAGTRLPTPGNDDHRGPLNGMRHLLRAIAVTLALLPLEAAPQASVEQTTSALPAEDSGFISALSKRILFDIECFRLAASRARSAELRSLAGELQRERSMVDADFRRLLVREQLPVPETHLGRRHRRMLDQLIAQSDGEFDRVFRETQDAAIDEAVGLLERYIMVADDGPLKDFATARLPVLRQQADRFSRLK